MPQAYCKKTWAASEWVATAMPLNAPYCLHCISQRIVIHCLTFFMALCNIATL